VVLAVEDEPLILMLAVDMIFDAGFEPVWASNVDEAIDISRAETISESYSRTSTCRDQWTD
jgi:DNA-binding response OmpR family regulator